MHMHSCNTPTQRPAFRGCSCSVTRAQTAQLLPRARAPLVTVAARRTTKFTRRLTPYQGPKRRYGFFKCKQCGRKWESASSWANIGQDCQDCGTTVYPHKQEPLLFTGHQGNSDPGKPHRQDLCDKCRQLGYNCQWVKVPDVGSSSDTDTEGDTTDDSYSLDVSFLLMDKHTYSSKSKKSANSSSSDNRRREGEDRQGRMTAGEFVWHALGVVGKLCHQLWVRVVTWLHRRR